MLPISEAMLAKSFSDQSDGIIDWILFDVYKIAPDFPLDVSVYGYILKENNAANEINSIYQEPVAKRIRVTDKFQSKSTRDDLMGLKLKCGLVVCMQSDYN